MDVVLYDSFAQPEADHADIDVLVANSGPLRRGLHVELPPSPRRERASQRRQRLLVEDTPARARDPVEAIAAGRVIVSDAPPRTRLPVGLDWPGRSEGLTDREAEVLALITQGKTNIEIAAVMYLSINTVKSYIRSVLRKNRRDHAIPRHLVGVIDTARPDHNRIDHWRGGP